jgi:oligopeptide/dipeptide ABC transporter ATP-binding protein
MGPLLAGGGSLERPGVTGPLLAIDGLVKRYPVDRGPLRKPARLVAVDGVSVSVRRGETLALVGESGSGKTSVARCLMRLTEPDAGRITYDGVDVLALRGRALRAFRRRMQMVFQDPYGSLNPRMTVGAAVREPLEIHGLANGAAADERAAALFREVGLDPGYRKSYPHELSGGQRQRVGIARALAVEPEFLVLDEPVSALDVSVQAQVLALLRELQERRGLTYLFIAHDLAVVRQMADRVAVMYLGRIVEEGVAEPVFAGALHPYTWSLLSAVPVPDPATTKRRLVREGDPPSPVEPPPGCPFHPRCPHPQKNERCTVEVPSLQEVRPSRTAACHYATTSPSSPPPGFPPAR